MSSSILYLPSSKIENQKKIGKKGKPNQNSMLLFAGFKHMSVVIMLL